MPGWPSLLARRRAPNWPLLLACGVLWGCAIAGIETLREPPVGAPAGAIIRFMASLMSAWCLMGVCWSLGAHWASIQPSRLRFIATWLVGVAGLGGAQTILNMAPGWLNNTAVVGAIVGGDIPFDAMLTHLLWLHAVFGGLYVAGYAVFERAVRSRRQLTRVQIALSDEAALWEEARLNALRGSLQPQILVQAVAELRARYETDPNAGDDLLDRLVAYLRASTGAWSGAPTTPDAPRTADAHRALIAALGADPTPPTPSDLSPLRSLP